MEKVRRAIKKFNQAANEVSIMEWHIRWHLEATMATGSGFSLSPNNNTYFC